MSHSKKTGGGLFPGAAIQKFWMSSKSPLPSFSPFHSACLSTSHRLTSSVASRWQLQFRNGLQARHLAEKLGSWLGFKVCSGYGGGDRPASQEANGSLCAWLKVGLNDCVLKKTGVLWKTRMIYGEIICEWASTNVHCIPKAQRCFLCPENVVLMFFFRKLGYQGNDLISEEQTNILVLRTLHIVLYLHHSCFTSSTS